VNGRERVIAAINHEPTDRVPIVLGVSNATSLQMGAYRSLKGHLDLDLPDRYLYEWPELGTAAVDEVVLQRMHSDVRGVLDRHPESTLCANADRDPSEPFIDSWGIGQIELEPGMWFPAIHPLQRAESVEDLDGYQGWPDMDDPSRVAHVAEQARRLTEEGEYAIMATPWLLFPFERAIQMQGMETFLLNMIERPDFARALLEKCASLCKRLMAHFLRELDEHVDIIKIGDDLGTTAGLLISPEMYREFLKPVHADYIAFIKERTSAKVFFHTDGDVFPLLEDFIEVGVDILNPIQPVGEMADFSRLNERYGAKLVFCGGVDTAHVLRSASPEEVRAETRRVIETLGGGSGFLLSSVHTITHDVPPENVLAMVDEAIRA
jgi:uroporphyrinogen decarboxylase